MVSIERRKDVLTSVQDAAAYTEDFKVCCRRKYSNLTRCWRLLLDTAGLGRVSFIPFCRAARAMGFTHVTTLWKQLDVNSSGFITLESWDPTAYKSLMQFRTICLREYGGLREAFQFGLDKVALAPVRRRSSGNSCRTSTSPGTAPLSGARWTRTRMAT